MNPKAKFYENNQVHIHGLLWMIGFLSSLLFIDSSYTVTLEALQAPIRGSNSLCLKKQSFGICENE
ncbi:MAG: hypothetical protein KA508_00350 [Gammaproteobacteria bacterium]|nr:hypothetical protein [Gammaproteobacteria bacterium]